jgi:hypothetical protein
MPTPLRRVRRAADLSAALVVALAFATGCDPPSVRVVDLDAGARLATSTSTSSSSTSRPRSWPVVVSIVVDQEAAWIADERWPLLPADGGFARLRREGTYARDMRYAHAATDTAPGHAALYTGAPPRVSGVWGNEIIDPATHEKVSILRDEASKLVWPGAPPTSAPAGSSMGPLKVDTVADRFRTAHHDAIIVSLSIKDRGAIFGGGRAASAILWYDKKLDRFVTSSVLGGAFPSWATPLDAPDEVRAKPWTLLDAAWVQSHAATPDDQPGEGELGGMPIVFPHEVAHASAVPPAFRGSPFADDAILGLALAAMSAEHAGEHPTFVALSLSANDYIGHTFGPDSWEAWDELRRLDASLARFFTQLDERFGPAGWMALLTGDHGITTMPEATAVPATRPWCAHAGAKTRGAGAEAGADRWERACGKVGRLMPEQLVKELRAAAAKALPSLTATATSTEPAVLGIADPYVYLTDAARALPASDLERLKTALMRTLLSHAEVDRVIDTSLLPETCPAETDESADALICRAFVPKRAGDLYVLVKRGSFFDPDVVVGKGTSHGSPYLFDRAVPLLVRAPGRAAAGRVLDAPVSFRAFTRTLSTLLGIEPPNFEAARALDLARGP